MKRREAEILKASVSWSEKVLTVKEEKAFQAGAEWADKTMIDKACEWLKEHYAPAGFVDGIFRKAMQNE